MRTWRSGSCGRRLWSSKNFSNDLWNASGVCNSWWFSIHERRTLNILSMSSCEWPDDKNDNCPPDIFFIHVQSATRRSRQLFFTSFEQLSPWMETKAFLMSACRETRVSPKATISDDREEFVLAVCGLKAMVTPNPCTKSDVWVSRGRLKELNSFEYIFRLLGHECFCASIESKMQQTWNSPRVPRLCALILDWDRAAQWIWRSLYWRLRWASSKSIWLLRAAAQWPTFRIIIRCLIHCAHLLWCE